MTHFHSQAAALPLRRTMQSRSGLSVHSAGRLRAGVPGFRFPCRLIRADGHSQASLAPFACFGSTCDSADVMAGSLLPPADAGEGDRIEIGRSGADGACLRTALIGFDRTLTVEIEDAPMSSTPGYGNSALAA